MVIWSIKLKGSVREIDELLFMLQYNTQAWTTSQRLFLFKFKVNVVVQCVIDIHIVVQC
jgi:hypothetical protein